MEITCVLFKCWGLGEIKIAPAFVYGGVYGLCLNGIVRLCFYLSTVYGSS